MHDFFLSVSCFKRETWENIAKKPQLWQDSMILHYCWLMKMTMMRVTQVESAVPWKKETSQWTLLTNSLFVFRLFSCIQCQNAFGLQHKNTKNRNPFFIMYFSNICPLIRSVLRIGRQLWRLSLITVHLGSTEGWSQSIVLTQYLPHNIPVRHPHQFNGFPANG